MRKYTIIATALTLLTAGTAGAQLPSASTRALGMGDNYTAAARGYAAVSWNPAALGLSGNPRGSFVLLPTRLVAGLDPVTLSDLKDYQGQFVPDAVREQWLQRIEAEGSEDGSTGADVNWLALQIGRFALQVSTFGRVVGNLSPGGAEIILFGNAGRTGQPREITLTGSSLSSHGASTVALSYGFPLQRSQLAQTSIGITAKYTVGHLFAYGEDRGSSVTADPKVSIRFPVIATREQGFDGRGGSGFGLDIGFATQRGALTLAAAAKNVINTFSWDESRLAFRQGLANFDQDSSSSDFDEQPFANAPADLRALANEAKFKPVLAAGVAYEVSKRLTISGDVRARAGDTTLQDDPRFHIGVGSEVRAIPLVPLRAGVALISGGYQLGGGVGLNLGPVNLAASVLRRTSDLGTDLVTMLTLLSTTGK